MKRKQLLKISVISAIVCGLALVYFFADARYSAFLPKCPFFALTGLYCPGCGSQRAVSALLHGDILEAVNYNLVFAASLPFGLYCALLNLRTTIYWIISDFGEKKSIWLNLLKPNRAPQKIFYSPVFVKVVLFVIVLFWILRNIPFHPFTLLAPV